MQLQGDLRAFIIDNFLFGQDDGLLSNDTSLMREGIIDSTGVLELVAFLHERYGVEVADEEIVPDNLDTVNKLIRFVQAKLGKAIAY